MQGLSKLRLLGTLSMREYRAIFPVMVVIEALCALQDTRLSTTSLPLVWTR